MSIIGFTQSLHVLSQNTKLYSLKQIAADDNDWGGVKKDFFDTFVTPNGKSKGRIMLMIA
jgi:hypothetical protein